MNKFLLAAVLTFIYSSVLLSQNSFFIKLSDGNYKFRDEQKGKFVVRDYYESTDPSKVGEYKLPGRTFLIAVPPNSKPQILIVESNDVALNNVVPKINPEAFLDKDSVLQYKDTKSNSEHFSKKNNEIEILGYTWVKNYYCAVVRINDVQFNDQERQLVLKKGIKIEIKLNKSFGNLHSAPVVINEKISKNNDLNNLIVNFQMAEQFKGKPNFGIIDTSGIWFKPGRDYIKLGTASEGLVRIYKSDLTALGVDVSSIDPRQFQLYESGSEQNIFVTNEESGVFGDNDYIEFFGSRNFAKNDYRSANGSNEEYYEYLNRYSDTSNYFLTWGIANGKRAYSVSGSPSGITDTLKYYSSLIHYEPNTMFQALDNDQVANQTPNWFKNKAWYWAWLVSKQSATAQLSNIYPGKTSKIFFKLISGASQVQTNSHNVTLSFNNVLLDSEVVNRNDQVILKGNVNSDKLINGANQLSLINYNNGTDPNYLAMDWYEIEYPRNLNMAGDSLFFELKDNFVNQVNVIKIGNVPSGSIEIFKVKPFLKRMTNFQLVSGSLIFSDTVNTNDAYVVVNSSGALKPAFYYKKNFTILRQIRQADYIAITHPIFLSTVQNYANSVGQMYSVNPVTVNVNDIYDEFAFGYPYPESIKSFIGNALQTWQQPLPSYLVIFGDAEYDYKHYYQKNTGIAGGGNFVPAYGQPISDIWYSVFNDSISIPQLKVGRIPCNTVAELNFYLTKVQNNFNSTFGEWNKDYLFFSGGKIDQASEMDQFKAVNDSLIDTYVKPKPLAGNYTHFYKVVSPFADFGPYTPEFVKDKISKGGVFISYLGHSGTSNWDNSISEVDQLNNEVNRNSLITDFGCSTNKFAEPDIICFGERFILEGQAIGYIANTSFGFSSTAVAAPPYFYSSIIQDSLYQIGDAHIAAKVKMLNAFGTSNVFKVFSLTNTLLGDPIVKIKIPEKPNFVITSSDINLPVNYINETFDSVAVFIAVNNYGLSIQDSLKVDFNHSMNGNTIQSGAFYITVPDFRDTIKIWLKTKNLAGDHIISVTLNSDQRVQEIYSTDNSAALKFNVSSLTLKSMASQKVENSALFGIKLLSPSLSTQYNIAFQLSTDEGFTSPYNGNVPSGPFFTKLPLTGLISGQRYWCRARIDGAGTNFSDEGSFINSGTTRFYIADKYAFDKQSINNTTFDNGKITLLPDTTRITVISAGTTAGSVCVIAKNGLNQLTNTLFSGMGIAVFDPVTMKTDTSAWYDMYDFADSVQSCANLINSLPPGKIVAMGVCDDAAFHMNATLRTAIQSLGSTKISQLQFRSSWALIGVKGALPGTVIEQIQGPTGQTPLHVDSLYSKKNVNGNFITNNIGPASKWNKIIIHQLVPAGAQISYNLLGIKTDNTIDSLGSVSVSDTTASIGSVDAKKYPLLKINGLLSTTTGTFPSINSIGVDYSGLPELGTNYQSVTLSSDTLLAGKTATLNFNVCNAGDSKADSIKVKVSVLMSDSSVQQIYESVIDTINSESQKLISVNYNAGVGTSNRAFVINIDPENKINEVYKDNNIYVKPFSVKTDSSGGTIKVTFDNQEIIDGDYISGKPVIKIDLNDPTLIPLTDTSAIKIMLNNRQIFYNDPAITYTFSPSNPKMVVVYKPSLQDGSYSLLVNGKNAFGFPIDSTGTLKTFQVSNELNILYCYNYPNPFNKDTYFTFKLTQIPDELHINIFTIAGRLIKKITKTSSELNYDFNRIYWDGRDEAGDVPANGVYLYKVIVSKNGEKHNVTQKLAIIR